jgi:predicted acylesterase/phospholipase RssA
MPELAQIPKSSNANILAQGQKQKDSQKIKPRSKLHSEMLLAQQSEVEFIAFSGGGAKGAIYSGVVKALDESGALAGVKAVAGSSAGAITAAFVASGIDPKKFEQLSQDTNLKGLLGAGLLPYNILPIGQDGKPLYALLSKTIRENISSFLNSANLPELYERNLLRLTKELEENHKQIEVLLKEKEVNAKEMERLTEQSQGEFDLAAKNRTADKILLVETRQNTIREEIQDLTSQREGFELQISKMQSMADNGWEEVKDLQRRCGEYGNSPIRFKDLALMRLLDPTKFKDLVVTAVRRDNGELEIFSAATTPDIDIALACRASASIPVVFKPVTINGYEYVDGGYRDNVPTKYFQGGGSSHDIEDVTDNPEKSALARKQGRTLAFAFGGGSHDDNLNVAIYSVKKVYEPNAIVKFLVDVVFKFIAKVGGVFKYTETEKDTLNSLRENALNTVPLDTKDVGTLSFNEAQRKAEYLHIKGYMETMGHLRNHEIGNGIDTDYLHKHFLLSVYEKVKEKPNMVKGWVQHWGDKINESRQDKSRALLSFVQPEKWVQQGSQAILEEYVILAATKRGFRSNDQLSNDTRTMGMLIEKLNASDTHTEIKSEFMKLLKIDQNGMDATKFEFKKEHFNELLARSKPHPSLSQGVTTRI